jgi:hypothetical protein
MLVGEVAELVVVVVIMPYDAQKAQLKRSGRRRRNLAIFRKNFRVARLARGGKISSR